jgi:hypothetical protein
MLNAISISSNVIVPESVDGRKNTQFSVTCCVVALFGACLLAASWARQTE